MSEVKYKDRPIGTPEEMAELGMDPTVYGSCQPTKGNVLGCPWFNRCPGKMFRDRKNGKVGPFNMAVLHQLSPLEEAAANTSEMPCHEYFYSGLANRAVIASQRKAEDMPHENIRIIAVEGDGKMFQERESVRLHAKRDPNCQACTEGKCHQMEDRLTKPREVSPFKRPKERYKQIALAAEMSAAIAEGEEDAVAAMERTIKAGGKSREAVQAG